MESQHNSITSPLVGGRGEKLCFFELQHCVLGNRPSEVLSLTLRSFLEEDEIQTEKKSVFSASMEMTQRHWIRRGLARGQVLAMECSWLRCLWGVKQNEEDSGNRWKGCGNRAGGESQEWAVMEAKSRRHTGVLHVIPQSIVPVHADGFPALSTHHGFLLSCLRELMPLVSDPQPVGANNPAKCSCFSSLAETILRWILYSSSEDPRVMVPSGPQQESENMLFPCPMFPVSQFCFLGLPPK